MTNYNDIMSTLHTTLVEEVKRSMSEAMPQSKTVAAMNEDMDEQLNKLALEINRQGGLYN